MIAGDIPAAGDPICAGSSGSSLPGAGWVCFRNRAHLTNVSGSRVEAKCAGRHIEFTAKGVAEMAVARKTERKSQRRQIGFTVGQPPEGCAKSQAGKVLVKGQAGPSSEDAREMKRRTMNAAGDSRQRQRVIQAPGKHEAGILRQLTMGASGGDARGSVRSGL